MKATLGIAGAFALAHFLVPQLVLVLNRVAEAINLVVR